jgi:hypothetical protein
MPARETLAEHRKTIAVLRSKNYTWREIAQFLTERGVVTDHTRIYRFMGAKMKEQFSIPTAASYEEALTRLKNSTKVNDKQWGMLAFHLAAHNRTASFRQLGQAVGYEVGPAKLHYGKFGGLLGSELGMVFAKMRQDDAESGDFSSSAIGSGSHYRDSDGEFQLIMHHELAKALERLDWFKQQLAPTSPA